MGDCVHHLGGIDAPEAD